MTKVEPVVSRDVMNLARIDKPALMRSLMQLGCAYSSQVLSYQKVMGQLQDALYLAGPSAARDHPETWGRLVESAVGAHLLNTASSGMQITYWREGNKEVDFVVSIRDWFRDITALPSL